MEALLFTAGLLVLIVGGLVLFARAWPRQRDAPGVGGYRAQLHGERDAGSDPGPAPGVQEDDDVRWSWGTEDADEPRD
ncbi:MAG TPA: hypothetical protein VGK16_16415 [Candidatus Limnocylindrales bacterium]